MIYFITAGLGVGPVKIGFTDDIEDRRRTLQAGNPQRLHVIAAMPGDIGRERRLHERFAAGRLVGEWFKPDTPGLEELTSAAIHFEGFFPEDTESESIDMVLSC